MHAWLQDSNVFVPVSRLFVFFRGGDSFATTGSPLGSGFSKKQKRKTPRLSVMPLCVLACCHFEDRACPVCYYCYLRKFLKRKDRRALFLIAKNCECDFIDDDVKDGKPEKESRFLKTVLPHLPK